MTLLGRLKLDTAVAVRMVVPVHKRLHPEPLILLASEWTGVVEEQVLRSPKEVRNRGCNSTPAA